MARTFRAVALLMVVALAVACSSSDDSSDTPSRPPKTTAGYLFVSAGIVAFLTWQQDESGRLEGSGVESYAVGPAPNATVTTKTYPLSGRLTGEAVELDVDDGHLKNGRIAGDTLTVDFTQSDGNTLPVTYHAASPVEYEQALSRLRTEVERANQG